MNAIEEKLWDYIDGNCSAEERENIGKLIENDPVYRSKYSALLKLNAGLSALELDEPSMAFTYNVMETIRTENAMKPLKAAINPRIVWGVGIFFALSITLLLIYTLMQFNWSAENTIPVQFDFTLPKIQDYLSGNVLMAFIFVDIIVALYLLDSYLRKKLVHKPTH